MKTHLFQYPSYPSTTYTIVKRLTNIALGIGLMGTVSVSHAAGYFINNLPSSGCSDTALDAGSESKPWCSFAPIADVTLNPGDTIHLAQGATWVNQTLRFNHVTKDETERPITIQAYGGGLQRPHITTDLGSAQGSPQAQKGYRGIVLNNASYWVIKDLEISYTGAGILFHYTEKNNRSIRLSNLYLHHNYGYERVEEGNQVDDIQFSGGIVFTGNNITLAPSESVVKDIVMEDIVATKNQDAITISFPTTVHAQSGAQKTQGARDIVLNRVRLYQNDGGGEGIATGCSDSLRLVKVYNVTLMNSLIENAGGCITNTGTAAAFLGYTDGAKLINNIIRNTWVMPGTPDQGGIDLEIDNSDVKIFGNLISGNQHAIECMMFHGADFRCDPSILGNGFINNRRSVMFINGTRRAAVGELKQNLYYTVSGSYLKWNDNDNFLNSETYDPDNAVFNLIATTENNIETNIAVSNPDDFYSAAGNFSNSQAGSWSYQFYNTTGSAWENLPTFEATSTRPKWTNSSHTIFVSPFEMKPSAHTGVTRSGAVARIWKAPKDGVVVVRGHIAKSELDPSGNGILAHIEKWDAQSAAITKLWPLATDRQYIAKLDMLGMQTQVESVVVKAGDVLRFIVSSNGDAGTKDAVTWAPMIAYTKDAIGNPAPKAMVWSFDTPNWLEYWGSNYGNIEAPTVGSDGSLKLEITQANPYILSRNFKNGPNDSGLLGSDGKFLRLRIKHSLSSVTQTQAVLRWTREGTAADQLFDDNKKVVITLNGSNDYQDIGPLNLNELNPSYWGNDSVITQLRLDPIENTTHEQQQPTINIDYIRLDSQ